MRPKYTQEQRDICCEMRRAGGRIKTIATVTGIPVRTVYQLVEGVTLSDGSRAWSTRAGFEPWTVTRIEFVRNNAGKMTPVDMAEQLNCSVDSLRHVASKHGFSLRIPSVSPEDERLCCELYKAGMKMKIIAEKMELDHRVVGRIIKLWNPL